MQAAANITLPQGSLYAAAQAAHTTLRTRCDQLAIGFHLPKRRMMKTVFGTAKTPGLLGTPEKWEGPKIENDTRPVRSFAAAAIHPDDDGDYNGSYKFCTIAIHNPEKRGGKINGRGLRIQPLMQALHDAGMDADKATQYTSRLELAVDFDEQEGQPLTIEERARLLARALVCNKVALNSRLKISAALPTGECEDGRPKCAKVKGRAFGKLDTYSDTPGENLCRSIEGLLKRGATIYIGSPPNKKSRGVQLVGYIKTHQWVDGKPVELPENEHRVRLEWRWYGMSCPCFDFDDLPEVLPKMGHWFDCYLPSEDLFKHAERRYLLKSCSFERAQQGKIDPVVMRDLLVDSDWNKVVKRRASEISFCN